MFDHGRYCVPTGIVKYLVNDKTPYKMGELFHTGEITDGLLCNRPKFTNYEQRET